MCFWATFYTKFLAGISVQDNMHETPEKTETGEKKVKFIIPFHLIKNLSMSKQPWSEAIKITIFKS